MFPHAPARSVALALLLLVPSPATAGHPAKAPSASSRPTDAASVTIRPVSDKDFVDVVLKPRKGKVVLVSFWASYCAPCLEELPGLFQLKSRLAGKGAEIVVVNVDPPGQAEQIRKIARTRGYPAFETLQVTNEDPQLFIDAVDKSWGGEVPFAVVYGRDGARKKTLSGEQTIAALTAAVEEALKP